MHNLCSQTDNKKNEQIETNAFRQAIPHVVYTQYSR